MDDVTLTKRILAYLGLIPGWSWRETGPPYTSDEVALFYGRLKPDPDRAIAARVYAPDDGVNVLQRRMQLRIRGNRGRLDGAEALSNVALFAMEGISRLDGILSARRISFTPFGADKTGREERTENYIITLDNLEAS